MTHTSDSPNSGYGFAEIGLSGNAVRELHDPLATSSQSRWLKVSDSMANELGRRELPPGHDLRAELLSEAARWAADGWLAVGRGGHSHSGYFFVIRGGLKRMVSIMPSAEPLPKRPR